MNAKTKAPPPPPAPGVPAPRATPLLGGAFQPSPLQAVETARIGLILSKSNLFFAQLCLYLNPVIDDTIPTACTNGVVVKFSPKYFGTLTSMQQRTLWAHEALHPAMGHLWRRGWRDPLLYNVAADFEINQLLKDAGFELGPGWCQDDKYREWSVERIYADLEQNAPESKPTMVDIEEPGQPGQGPSSPGSSPSNGDSPVSGEQAAKAVAEIKKLEEQWKNHLASAMSQAQQHGLVPAGMPGHVDQLLTPKVDWRSALANFLTARTKSDWSYRRPNRRYSSLPFAMPSLDGVAMAPFVVVRDTSGSMLGAMARVVSELDALRGQMPCEKIGLIDNDAKAVLVGELGMEDLIPVDYSGGGGTNFCPAFDMIERDLSFEPSCIVFVTDGDGVWPAEAPPYPLLVILTKHHTPPPYGQTVVMEEEE